ncbi:FAD-dependent oxidoreductase [Cypionkella sp.]|uniref:FAD-dependent oxidoreductase n=1 Tax=Cypionkella sp. TaxID=2811411 RepID=UPI00345BC219
MVRRSRELSGNDMEQITVMRTNHLCASFITSSSSILCAQKEIPPCVACVALLLILTAMNDKLYDCVIVGGGPAGLTAAIYIARYHLDVIVVEDGRSRAAMIPLSHNHAVSRTTFRERNSWRECVRKRPNMVSNSGLGMSKLW